MAERERARNASYWFPPPPAPTNYGTGQGLSDETIAALLAQGQPSQGAQRIQDAINQAELQRRRLLQTQQGQQMLMPLVNMGLANRGNY